jgi:hypothetical protein
VRPAHTPARICIHGYDAHVRTHAPVRYAHSRQCLVEHPNCQGDCVTGHVQLSRPCANMSCTLVAFDGRCRAGILQMMTLRNLRRVRSK